MSLSIPRLLKLALIVAVATAPWPLPRPEAPSAIAASTLRIGQLQDDSERLKRTGLEEAVRGRKPPATPNFESGLEEGALFTRWGRPIRLPQELFDPNNDGAFKLLVVAWLMTRPSAETSEAEAAIAAAIREVITHRDPLGDATNAKVVGKVWVALGQSDDATPGAATRLAEAMKADLFTAASDPHAALHRVQDALPTAALALDSLWDREHKYRDLAQPVQAAVARMAAVQRVLVGLRSPGVGEHTEALRALHGWLLTLRWSWSRGAPDAIERQADALATAVLSLTTSHDGRVAKKAERVKRLMARRPDVFGTVRSTAEGAVPRPPPEVILARLTALRGVTKALEKALVEGREETMAEALARITQGPQSVATGFPNARKLEALLGVDEPGLVLHRWGPHDRALLTWTPRILRIIEKHLAEGGPIDPGALYRHLEDSVAWLRRARDEGKLAPTVAPRVAARLAAWDSERAWPTPADRAEAFIALISRIKAHVGLAAGLEEARHPPGRPPATPEALGGWPIDHRITPTVSEVRQVMINLKASNLSARAGALRQLHEWLQAAEGQVLPPPLARQGGPLVESVASLAQPFYDPTVLRAPDSLLARVQVQAQQLVGWMAGHAEFLPALRRHPGIVSNTRANAERARFPALQQAARKALEAFVAAALIPSAATTAVPPPAAPGQPFSGFESGLEEVTNRPPRFLSGFDLWRSAMTDTIPPFSVPQDVAGGAFLWAWNLDMPSREMVRTRLDSALQAIAVDDGRPALSAELATELLLNTAYAEPIVAKLKVSPAVSHELLIRLVLANQPFSDRNDARQTETVFNAVAAARRLEMVRALAHRVEHGGLPAVASQATTPSDFEAVRAVVKEAKRHGAPLGQGWFPAEGEGPPRPIELSLFVDASQRDAPKVIASFPGHQVRLTAESPRRVLVHADGPFFIAIDPRGHVTLVESLESSPAGLTAGLEEDRVAAMDRAAEAAGAEEDGAVERRALEATRRLTEFLGHADLHGRAIVIGPEALAYCPALRGLRGLSDQVYVPDRSKISTTTYDGLAATVAARGIRAFEYVGNPGGLTDMTRAAGVQRLTIARYIHLDLSPDKALRQVYQLLRIPQMLWNDRALSRQIFQDLDTRSQA